MTSSQPLIGLVLAGGGAKGAYHAGALSYLAEIGLQPQIIAGTSIGALNGAVLAANGAFPQSVVRLNQLWEQLGQAKILRPNTNAAFQVLNYAAQLCVPTFKEWTSHFLVQAGLLKKDFVVFDPEPIEHFLRQAVSLAELKQGTELWVAAFPSMQIPGLKYDALMVLMDLFRAHTGTRAHWLCAQDCNDEELLYEMLLASAAIPLMFPTRAVNGQTYVDGGLADNVPLGALAAQGCTHAIVIHLDNGSVWNRHDFPNQTVIEIRPINRIHKSDTPLLGGVSAILDFSPARIAELKDQGYKDARRCLEPIIQTFQVVQSQRHAHQRVTESTQRLLNDAPLF